MNQYHIYEKIGRGKHSVVYKGRKKKTIQYYAIKSVEKSQKPRVLQEVRTMHALKHNNILKFIAWYETSNHLWLILEYCVGGDLVSLLKQDLRLPESSIHDFGRDIVVALQYLHSNSIIYCDLKPSNVLLDENGVIKLGGFGLSRRLSDINKTPLNSLPPAKRGTPCYMAPELFSEGATHSSASDLWALGCVLYECSTGRPPFMSSTFNQLAHDILNNEPPPMAGASKEFEHLLGRLLDKNPATRISWQGLVQHPFWQLQIPALEMPPEPALEAFIRQYNLAPTHEEAASTRASKAFEAAQSLRASVDVTRLSRIALNNLEKDGEGADYTAAQATDRGDIKIENADAELDFEEAKEEGGEDEEPNSSATGDDGALIDQSTPMSNGGHVNVVESTMMNGDVRKSQVPRSRPVVSDQSYSGTSADDTGPSGQRQEQTSGIQEVTSAEASPTAAPPAVGTASDLEALMWYPSDSAVKPIVANRRIERLPEPKWDRNLLPFQPLTLQEMLSSDQKELEGFLTHIYRAIASAAPLKDKANVLTYFETLCVDTNAANVLINSSLTILFIRMLRNARAPTLRIKLASVLGLLLRHATYIADELAGTEVVEILAEALKDKNERVRRRVMATLGELLFYIATQQQDAAAAGGGGGGGTAQDTAAAWHITPATIAAVARLLRAGEDEVAQHYAAKTIENIASQGGDWSAKFATQDVVINLVQLYNAGKGENLRTTIASTLARLLRGSPEMLSFASDKYGARLFVAGLSDSSSKVQVAALNMLNLALSRPGDAPRAVAGLSDERGFLGALMGLQDQGLPHLRAKAIVTVLLLCRLSRSWLLECCQEKVLPWVERLVSKEKDPPLEEAVAALRDELARAVAGICHVIREELAQSAGGRGSTPGSSGSSSRGTSAGGALGRKQTPLPTAMRAATVSSVGGSNNSSSSSLPYLQVVLHVITSPYFRTPIVNPALLSDLSACLLTTALAAPSPPPQATAGDSTTASTTPPAALQEFKSTLMHVLEAACQQVELMSAHFPAVLQHLLPALAQVVTAQAETGDTRFFCLRMISDILYQYLHDDQHYASAARSSSHGSASTSSAGGNSRSGGGATAPADSSNAETVASTAALDALLQQHVLPMIPRLLKDEDPMPLYALKLLGGILDASPSYVRHVESMGLAPEFFEFLSLEHSNNNVHNIRLCRQLVAAGSAPASQVQGVDIGSKVHAVLVYAAENNVEPFLEPVLELCLTILRRERQEIRAAGGGGTGIAGGNGGGGPPRPEQEQLLHSFLQQLHVFLDLCMHPDSAVAIAASANVAELVELYPWDTVTWLLSSEGADMLGAALRGQVAEGEAPPAPTMQATLLRTIAGAIKAGGKLPGSSKQLEQLVLVLEDIEQDAVAAGSGEGLVVQAAAAEARQLLSAHFGL